MGQFNTLDDILGVLYRRFFLIMGIALIGVALSLVYAARQPRVYEATAVIQIELSGIADASPRAQDAGTQAKYRLNLIEQQLMARGALEQMIRDLGLYADSDDPMAEKVGALRESVRIEQIIDPAAAWQPGAVPSGLTVTVRMGDPVQAAQVANSFLDKILEQSEARRRQQVDQTLDFFLAEEARVAGKIAALEERIAEFKRANAASMPAAQADLRRQLTALKQSELELDQQILSLKANAARVREDVLARQIQELEVQKQLVAERIAEAEAALAAAPEVERVLGGLERELSQLEEQLSVVTRRRAEAEMDKALEASQGTERFTVLERALVPEHAVAPSRKKIVALGALMFLGLGVGLAFVLEMLNPAIRTAQQLERALGITPIVTIPDLDQSRPGTGWRNRLLGLAMILAVFALLGTILRDVLSGLMNAGRRLAAGGAEADPAARRVIAGE